MRQRCRVTEKVKIALLIYRDFFIYHVILYTRRDTDNEKIQRLCHIN